MGRRLRRAELLQHVGHSPVRTPQVSLPRGVDRVGLGQPLRDAERLAEEPLGLGQIPLRPRQLAELVERHRQVALPLGVGRVGLGQPLQRLV